MQVDGDYHAKGYASIAGLVPPEVARAFLHRLQADLSQSQVSLQTYARQSPLLKKGSVEIYGYHYKPMITFLWGLTPSMIELTGRDLLPTYNYFRIYRQGDVCRVHSDRASCEHSLSLTLGYSDDKPWDLQIGSSLVEEPRAPAEDFGDEPYSSIPMQPGDAVLYKGVEHRHGRVTPNPNRWSAHMFLHWIDRDGPYRSQAFDGQADVAAPVEFNLG